VIKPTVVDERLSTGQNKAAERRAGDLTRIARVAIVLIAGATRLLLVGAQATVSREWRHRNSWLAADIELLVSVRAGANRPRFGIAEVSVGLKKLDEEGPDLRHVF